MISLTNVCKNYDKKVVFENFNLQIEKGKVLCVLGESGSGKTTLLNILTGVTDFNGQIEGLEKPFSVVFQKDRLIPNLTVLNNLRLVNKDITPDHLEIVGLKGTENLFPKSLSAGMARRVAILRALLFDAKTLFMDEPFINLDIAVKYSIIEKIKSKRQEQKDVQTVVMVTHDIKEAVTIADRIVVLSNGQIIKDIGRVTADTEKKLFELFLKTKMQD